VALVAAQRRDGGLMGLATGSLLPSRTDTVGRPGTLDQSIAEVYPDAERSVPMRRLALILGVSLAILATALPTPARAFPMRFAGAQGHLFAGGPRFARSFAPPFIRRPFFRGRRFGGFALAVPVPIGIYGAWPPFYGYPPYYGYAPAYDASTYYPSQAAYDPPPAYAPPEVQAIPPVSPPMPDVVEYSTGRYQLRGDGTTTAYTWVWIPNPPLEPPAQSGADDASAPTTRPSPGRLYRWTDDQGVVHLTNVWKDVPQQYRQQAKHSQTS